jgi:catechol 2,3-dioxygenase-like lactoylglutathione lyase family enzyme
MVQVAYAVDDVRAAAERWHETTGIGPFFVREHVPTARVSVNGSPAVFDHTCALAWWGEVMVELVQHHELAPPTLAGSMAGRPGALHHVACFVDDLDATLKHLGERGWPIVMDAETPQTRFVFVDPGPEAGHLVELYEENEYLSGLYAQVRDAALNWDGVELFRERAR